MSAWKRWVGIATLSLGISLGTQHLTQSTRVNYEQLTPAVKEAVDKESKAFDKKIEEIEKLLDQEKFDQALKDIRELSQKLDNNEMLKRISPDNKKIKIELQSIERILVLIMEADTGIDYKMDLIFKFARAHPNIFYNIGQDTQSEEILKEKFRYLYSMHLSPCIQDSLRIVFGLKQINPQLANSMILLIKRFAVRSDQKVYLFEKPEGAVKVENVDVYTGTFHHIVKSNLEACKKYESK
jgi:hypothetical protein